MQKPLYHLKEEDRRIARKWSMASIGFYGSILAGLVIYGATHTRAVDMAAVTSGPEARLISP